MRVYATTADLESWTGQPAPDNAAALLRYASGLVTGATRNDLYDTDPAGMPTDQDVLGAMRDATCTQAAMWAATGIDPVAGAAGVGAGVTSSSIGGASISYDSAGATALRVAASEGLDQRAADILAAAGLASMKVSSW